MENQGKYWDLYQQIKDLKKKQKKQLHKLYIDFALLLFFEWTLFSNIIIDFIIKRCYNCSEIEQL